MDSSRCSPPVIGFLTDFNTVDPYIGIVKGVIADINPRAKVIDLTHNIPAQDVVSGALMLAGAYRYFPKGTIFLAVVDPGVGSGRKAIIAQGRGYQFVLPDNGLISFVHSEGQDKGTLRYFYIENKKYLLEETSRTFHARDVFGPVAAHLSRGVAAHQFGSKCTTPTLYSWDAPVKEENSVHGKILYIDTFGNLITNIRPDDISSITGPKVAHIPGVKGLIPLRSTYSDVSPGKPLCLPGSFGFLEIAVNQGSAAESLGVSVGREVEIRQGDC